MIPEKCMTCEHTVMRFEEVHTAQAKGCARCASINMNAPEVQKVRKRDDRYRVSD